MRSTRSFQIKRARLRGHIASHPLAPSPSRRADSLEGLEAPFPISAAAAATTPSSLLARPVAAEVRSVSGGWAGPMRMGQLREQHERSQSA
jgi:hypothetical protein